MLWHWWLLSENTPAAGPPRPLHRAESESKGLLSKGLSFLTALFVLPCKSALCAKYLLTHLREGGEIQGAPLIL